LNDGDAGPPPQERDGTAHPALHTLRLVILRETIIPSIVPLEAHQRIARRVQRVVLANGVAAEQKGRERTMAAP
jgi:hypothetical protein